MIINEINAELDKIRSLIGKVDINGDQHNITADIITAISIVREFAGEQHVLLNARLQISQKAQSYADVVKKRTVLPPKGHKSVVAVVVKSKSKEATSEQTMSDLKKSINPASLGINVASVKRITNGAVVVALKDKCSADHLRSAINEQNSLDCHAVKKQNPYILVQYVPDHISADEIVEIIKNNHKDGDVRIAFQNKIKNTTYRNITLHVDAKTWNTVLSLGFVNISWHRLKLINCIPIQRCFKCQAFGHSSKKCTDHKNICAWCTGFHDISQCSSNCSSGKCINCARSNANLKTKYDTFHAANSKECSVFKAFKHRMINNTVYQNV